MSIFNIVSTTPVRLCRPLQWCNRSWRAEDPLACISTRKIENADLSTGFTTLNNISEVATMLCFQNTENMSLCCRKFRRETTMRSVEMDSRNNLVNCPQSKLNHQPNQNAH